MGNKGKKEMAGKMKFLYNTQPTDKYLRQIQSRIFLQEPPTVIILMPCWRENNLNLTIARPYVS